MNTQIKINFNNYSYLTFDCYGTLIDWESGILNCFKPVIIKHDKSVSDEEIIKLYAKYEAIEEAGIYKKYYEILKNVAAGIYSEIGITPGEEELKLLPESAGTWRPFPDTVEFLRLAQKHFKLAVISNIDDSIFEKTEKLLGIKFDNIITAEQAGSYKPSLNNFYFALNKLGVDKSRVLHIAQSVYHDHVPAKKLGIASVRVNRKSICAGTGVALPAEAQADLEVPDLQSLTAILQTL